ncbi:RNA 3'-phosphate cyclase [Candidatus Pacearchaeota archaeon ex4484_26]|nr:MAG: RNA 3'-phosphate cyclase [Candidatus Pacearchaeota archaeon ex4484_26]
MLEEKLGMLEIDGSYGEGGGSIVRLACAFSAVTGKPFKIYNIRAKRDRPGLKAQHLTAVESVAKLCGADVKGLYPNSKELEFHPSEIKSGNLDLDVGTAGSIALVLQALMIPAFHASSEINIKIKGGTHTKHAPTIGYLQNVTLPLLKKIGYKAEINLNRYGFYPKGGGIVKARVWPSRLKPVTLTEKGRLEKIVGEAVATKGLQKARVAERMKEKAVELCEKVGIKPKIKINYVDAYGNGAAIDIFALYENSVIGGSAIGEIRKSAEDVARKAVERFSRAYRSKAPIDMHAADQLLPYLALATNVESGKSKIKVESISEHTKTNIWLLKKFLSVDFLVKGNIIEIKKK